MKMQYRIENLLKAYIPTDNSRQVTSEYYLEYLFNQKHKITNVMDLGCGRGDSLDYFHRIDPNIQWIGLDIETSPEVESRIKAGVEFHSFDGIHIPFNDNFFDLIYCNQVFEHVRYPAELLREVQRVLKVGGYFVGSTSQLEPYHSYSTWNYTPYGFRLLLEDAKLQLIELRPGIDGMTLIVRRGFGRPRFFQRWFEKESPLNLLIGLLGKMGRKDPRWINSIKLLFCGQFSFLVCKPDQAPTHENSVTVRS